MSLPSVIKSWSMLIKTSKRRPYLDHVKSLSVKWPHLRVLADFMEIGTSPTKWADLQKQDNREEARAERVSRTQVVRLLYLKNGETKPSTASTPDELLALLMETSLEEMRGEVNLKLFVVKDLSRDVIEHLGSQLDIEPAFFREQILDYAWYNTRDRWLDPPNLGMMLRKRRWLTIRYVTARYYANIPSFKEAQKQAATWNVLRRPDDDNNNRALWDQEGAVIGICRTRASFWMKAKKDAANVAVLLLDPTITEGFPLWMGYRNWERTPGIDVDSAYYSRGPPRTSFFDDFIYWAQNPKGFTSPTHHNHEHNRSNTHYPVQALLHMIGAEWLLICEYIKTRLEQINWEITFPKHFLPKDADIDNPLNKLHIWRRLVPLYREMLNETLLRVFSFPCHTVRAVTNSVPADDATPMSPSSYISTATTDTTQTSDTGTTTGPADAGRPPPNQAQQRRQQAHNCSCTIHSRAGTPHEGPINAFREDFAAILSYMEEYQQRIDRLTSVVTAVIGIRDSRRGLRESRNVGRLTWLATVFIPLSFVATLFSMQQDIHSLADSLKWYFVVSLPLCVVSMGIVFLLTLPSVQQWSKGAWSRLLAVANKAKKEE